MNATSKLLVAGFVLLLCTSTASAHDPSSEPIDVTVVFGQPIEMFFPNEFDLIHDKILTFEGSVQNLDLQAGTLLQLRFDWLDPSDPTGDPHKFSPPVFIELGPGEGRGVFETYTIPFCPQQVSLDLSLLSDSGGPVEVHGIFSHHCVPEPGTWVLLASGLAAVLSVAHRRRRQK